ncbi:hypothetical protein CEE39_00710 [bacterium (candidate division B38) B3_B38]|nr:MAG: hypothetical protein CEE39_00710 [bacterium (candidate division B38) B3_B38]
MYKDQSLSELQDAVFRCVKCGMCRSICPVFQIEGAEASVARGRLALIEEFARDKLKAGDNLTRVLSACIMCGRCQANRPNLVEVVKLIRSGRSELARFLGMPLSRKLIMELFYPRKRLYFAFKLGSWLQKFLLRRIPKERGLRLRYPIPLLNRGVAFPPIAREFFLPKYSSTHKASRERMRVGFFVGCLINFVLPEIGTSLLEVLTKNGVSVVLPAEQGCCGLPAFLSGQTELANKLNQKNLEAFRGLDIQVLVTACPTCGEALKGYYELVNKRGERIEVLDISQFLWRHKELFSFPKFTDGILTYHDPCHLKHIQGVDQEPRKLLKMIADGKFVEMDEADLCCGFGGLYSFFHSQTASAINKRKMKNIESSGANTVVTACPGCLIYFRQGIQLKKLPVKAKHLIDVLRG